MLPGKLVVLIESNGGPILDRTIARIRREPAMTHFSGPVESELRDWGQTLLKNLSYWLRTGREQDLGPRYERFGIVRSEEGVPLEECIRALAMLREEVLDCVEEHLIAKTSIELYAEEEFDRQLTRFFDFLTFHLVRGYESGLRETQTRVLGAAG